MRRNLAITAGLALVLLASACSNEAPSPSPSAPTTSAAPLPSGATGDTGTIINPSGSVPPTSSPGFTGAVTKGSATVTTVGGVNSVVAFSKLVPPALWVPPPGGIALQWAGSAQQSLSLGGPAFTSQQPTSASRILSFTVKGPAGALVQFRSAGGECLVTINPALPDDMGGIFDCRNLTSADGTLTVSAQGSFTATG